VVRNLSPGAPELQRAANISVVHVPGRSYYVHESHNGWTLYSKRTTGTYFKCSRGCQVTPSYNIGHWLDDLWPILAAAQLQNASCLAGV